MWTKTNACTIGNPDTSTLGRKERTIAQKWAQNKQNSTTTMNRDQPGVVHSLAIELEIIIFASTARLGITSSSLYEINV